MKPIIKNNYLPTYMHKLIVDNYNNVQWFFEEHSSHKENIYNCKDVEFSNSQFSLSNISYDIDRGGVGGNLFYTLQPLVNSIETEFNLEIEKLIRVRAGLLLTNHKGGLHNPHVDYEYPHKTLLYYLNDSDGDTIFFNETHDTITDNNLTVQLKNKPTANQAVLFDGLQFHSSSFPVDNNYRIAININFV